ncbi:MAG: phage tail protein [Bacteroidales bacterium]|nr:phage tail protein [Bacteroidales bacterium]
MAALKSESPMVGFRYEVSIIPEPQFSGTKANAASIASSAVSAVDKASFSEISGVTVSLETTPVKSGNGSSTDVPRGISYSPLVLKRGLTGAQSELMAWVAANMLQDDQKKFLIVRKTVIINLLSDQGAPLMSWVFIGAYPTKWSMSGLKAMSNELVIEELELKYERFYPVVLGV